ncbi:MAG TPA: hypothetical protein DHV62_06470 [Elusimicrobia bacterium]|jgi:hypothetical protein|nr:hypothetical protein [Elusimicrobiota bacterium]
MKRIFIFLFLALNYLLSTINYLHAKDYYSYFYDAQSIRGGSGKIINPSTQTVAYRNWALGLHYFQLSLSYGLFPGEEIGIFFNLKELSEKKFDLKKISFHTKYQFLNWEEKHHSFACGWQNDHFYLVSDKFFPSLSRWGLLLGLSILGENKKIKIAPFSTIYQTPRMSMFTFDYNAEENTYNLGWRFLLSPKVKFDLFLIDLGKIKDINNFVFGVTLSS